MYNEDGFIYENLEYKIAERKYSTLCWINKVG